MGILHITGGVLGLQRKIAGRIVVIICASLGILLGLFFLYSIMRILFVIPVFVFEPLMYSFILLALTLGYGIFAMIVMCRSDYADEFE